MARRPLHLRWIYVEDHALLFAALAASLVVLMVVPVVLAEDPARGLLLGALPVVFAVVVWALTNRAGYPNRAPETLPHARPGTPQHHQSAEDDASAEDEGPMWDPFDGQRLPVVEAASETIQETAMSGDPFAVAPPAEPAKSPSNRERSPKAKKVRAPTMAARAMAPEETVGAEPLSPAEPAGEAATGHELPSRKRGGGHPDAAD